MKVYQYYWGTGGKYTTLSEYHRVETSKLEYNHYNQGEDKNGNPSGLWSIWLNTYGMQSWTIECNSEEEVLTIIKKYNIKQVERRN